MKSTVWFAPMSDGEAPEIVGEQVVALANAAGLSGMISPGAVTGILQHVGERDNTGHVKPPVTKAIAGAVRADGGEPFLTGSATLYRGRRSNAPSHITQARDHGFTDENIDCPIVMCDGLVGADRIAVPVAGARHCQTAYLGSAAGVMDALVVVSHPTGHPSAGYAASIKNVAMGLSSRSGKVAMHHGGRPEFIQAKCTACGRCADWCPVDAITVADVAIVDQERCIGCGQCLTVCVHDAVTFEWGEAGPTFQERLVEYCLAAQATLGESMLYLNVIQHFQEGCDCFGVEQDAICPDVGVVASRDIVAVDTATADLLARGVGRDIAFDTGGDYRHMLNYAQDMGLGSCDYELVEP